ncbi:MAG TPA: peptidoglycan binding domain-containing protein, partial [Candidatus Limnocylindrales bacterium]|nr:peptidoglycan binding domain-containing protein [Candidatus Limnocylindrales bacterium]
MTDELMNPPAIDLATEPVVQPHRRVRLRFFVAFLAGLIAALAIGVGALYAFDQQYAGKVLPGVHVGAVDLSGMTPAEASARLTEAYASFGEGQAVLTYGGLEMAIDYAKIQRRPDVEAMVTEALAVGRSGSTVDRAILNVRTALRGVEIVPKVTFDASRLARYVQTHVGRLSIEPKDAAVTTTKEGFDVVDGVDGRRADRLPATEFLTAALARVDAPAEIRVELETGPVTPEVTTADANAAKVTADKIALD